MKTILSAPALDEGSCAPKSNGGAPTPEEMMQEAIRKATKAPASDAAADGPRYGQAYYNQGERYPVGDPTTPVSDGAKVKMQLARRNNENLQTFVGNHIASMASNPNFVTPMPPAADLLANYTAFQTAFANWVAMKTACDDASTALVQARGVLEETMKVRGAYVQQASNGNTNVIVTSGLDVRNLPTPVGVLPPPQNGKIELNGISGEMYLKWSPVASARGYNIQWSPASTMERNWQAYETTTASRYTCEDMTVGEIYAFRIAAIGGSTGQSAWSVEVIRMAA